MKALLILLLTFTAYAQPKVGLLRVYNCLNKGATFTSYLNGEKLDLKPMPPGSKSNAMMLKTGEYKLHLQSKDFHAPPMQVMILENQTHNTIALHSFNTEKKALEAKVMTISPQYNTQIPKGFLPLKIRSLSSSKLTLSIADKEVVVPPMKSVDFNSWKGTSFTLQNNGEFIKKMKLTEKCPHTLLVWDTTDGKKSAVLIPSMTVAIPKGLRDDLSFGRTRDQIPNLRTLKPRE